MSDRGELRGHVERLLSGWADGTIEPREVFAQARAIWLSPPWPKVHERGYDPVAMDVLFMLADARDMGLIDADLPALRQFVEDGPRDFDLAQARMHARLESVDMSEREAMEVRDDYYGVPASDAEVEREEISFPDPEQRRLHRGVRVNPESVWGAISLELCEPPPRDEMFLVDLVEDLMYDHADQFIDRLETLAENCPRAREIVVMAYVGGLASTPALERFWGLQDNLKERM